MVATHSIISSDFIDEFVELENIASLLADDQIKICIGEIVGLI